MVEVFTPEVITIAIVALAAFMLFMFLMVLITIVLLFRVKKHLLVMGNEFLALEEEHASLRQDNQTINTHIVRLGKTAEKIIALEPRLSNLESQIPVLAEAAETITSIERRLVRVDERTTESQKKLAGHASKLNEYDTLLGRAGQLIGKEAAGFNQAVQRINTLEGEFQGLKVFLRTFDQIRNRILDFFGAMQVEMPPQNAPTTEQKVPKEETLVPSEEKLPDTEDFHKSRML